MRTTLRVIALLVGLLVLPGCFGSNDSMGLGELGETAQPPCQNLARHIRAMSTDAVDLGKYANQMQDEAAAAHNRIETARINDQPYDPAEVAWAIKRWHDAERDYRDAQANLELAKQDYQARCTDN